MKIVVQTEFDFKDEAFVLTYVKEVIFPKCGAEGAADFLSGKGVVYSSSSPVTPEVKAQTTHLLVREL